MPLPRLIPCLDVAGGSVVKGVRFEGLTEVGDPIELGTLYSDSGADELVYLDVKATLEGRDALVELVARIADRLSIPFTVGGGVRSVADASALLEAGADKIAVNSAALERPELLSELAGRLGSQAVVVAIDATGGSVRTRAATQDAGRSAVAWACEAADRGAGEILLTSIDADGTRSGYDLALTASVSEAVSVPVIASGGAGSAEHVAEALGVAQAALLASILHEDPGASGHASPRTTGPGSPAARCRLSSGQQSSRTRRRTASSCSRGWTTRHSGSRARRARRTSSAARGSASGARARRRATRSRWRSFATTATATRSSSAFDPPGRRATPARRRASRRGSGAASPIVRGSDPRARTSRGSSPPARPQPRARSARKASRSRWPVPPRATSGSWRSWRISGSTPTSCSPRVASTRASSRTSSSRRATR